MPEGVQRHCDHRGNRAMGDEVSSPPVQHLEMPMSRAGFPIERPAVRKCLESIFEASARFNLVEATRGSLGPFTPFAVFCPKENGRAPPAASRQAVHCKARSTLPGFPADSRAAVHLRWEPVITRPRCIALSWNSRPSAGTSTGYNGRSAGRSLAPIDSSLPAPCRSTSRCPPAPAASSDALASGRAGSHALVTLCLNTRRAP